MLDDFDARFDPDQHAVKGLVSSVGYHTKLTPGAPTHLTLEAFQYAMELLATGDAGRCERAALILRRVPPLQITDPTDPAYGVWPWSIEEPVHQMSPPDWNWADFCGMRLATILKHSAEMLPADLRAQAREALCNAAWCVFRRNVQPGYTNIAIMGGGFAAIAGELLGESLLVQYGRQRLQNCVAAAEYNGGFNEYNSPTYTMVVIAECDRTLNLVADAATRAAAEQLRCIGWRTVAESFHPATQQWGGPHSRTYGDHISVAAARFISRQTGVTITPHSNASAGNEDSLEQRPCPAELIERFRTLPGDPHTIRRRFQRREPDETSTYGTTWFGGDACLASVNEDTFWIQRRPILGYWRSAQDSANVLRVRVLHNDNDFASAVARTVQEGGRFLSLITLLANRGSHHDHLDRPADGFFDVSSFKIRVELHGSGATLRQESDRTFRLIGGETCAAVSVGGAMFDGSAVGAVSGQSADVAWVEIPLYDGPTRKIRIADLAETWAAVGVAIQPSDATSPPVVTTRALQEGRIEAVFGELKVAGSTMPYAR